MEKLHYDIQNTTAYQWYKAATLTERRGSPAHASTQRPFDDDQKAQAKRQLDRWKKLAAFQDTALFRERLAYDHLTEQELLQIMEEPVECLAQRVACAEVPLWIQQLEQALSATRGEPLHTQAETDQGKQSITLLEVFKPLIDTGCTELKQGIEQLVATDLTRPFDVHAVFDLLVGNLTMRLYNAALLAVILEMHIARMEQRLSGETPEERFTHFLQQLCERDRLRLFLLEYPVLARSLHAIIQQWANASLELLQRLSADWSEICATFAQGIEPGKLVEIRMGAGDTHREGRSVAVLCFSSGFQIVYKPRSLALDRHFQELLEWLNVHGLAHPLRTLILLDKGIYGWAEFVQAQECMTEEEVRRFYIRQGYYLALLYALDAGDFHHENLLASGENPYLIDLEALFHPRFAEQNAERVETAATQSIGYSVLRTGLLPQRMQLEAGGEGIDISGLGGKGGQLTPRPIPIWKDQGTDQMHIKREQREMAEEKNRPKLRGQDVDALAYELSILEGFTEMYRLLVAHRMEWLSHLLPRFEQDEIRVILRHTRLYGTLLLESYHPELLQDALEQEILFDHLWNGVVYAPHLRRTIALERRDLEEGNIPLFTTCPTSTDIFTSRGERIADFCIEPSIEFVKKRFQQMNEDDLARQQWIIKASLVTTIMDGSQHAILPPVVRKQEEVTREHLLHAAGAIGDRLEELALASGQGVNWLGVNFVREIDGKTVWSLQELSPIALYDGIPGIVHFLSYLGAVTGNTKYTSLAKSALVTVQRQIDRLLRPDLVLHTQASSAQSIGAYEGLGSLVYLFSHLGVLWHDTSYIALAQELLELVERGIEQDTRLDIIAGSAGCLACLLSLHQVSPSPRILTIAAQCGDRLLACAQPMSTGIGWYTLDAQNALPGFSHGVAGISLSLLRLASASREERFRQVALEAIAYERSLFDTERRNWPRILHQRGKDFPVSWCHGAPGIGLGRLAALNYINDEQIGQEIEIALETTIKHGFGQNQSICHGDLGNLETVLMAAQVLNESGYHEHLKRLTTQVFCGIQEYGWVTGVPLGVETPGLMTGLAGIGYELLRLAAPGRVPSVLLLAPPSGRP